MLHKLACQIKLLLIDVTDDFEPQTTVPWVTVLCLFDLPSLTQKLSKSGAWAVTRGVRQPRKKAVI